MTHQTITNIEYFRAASQQKPSSASHGVNVHRDQKTVVVEAFDTLQNEVKCVVVNFADVAEARKVVSAIKQQYGSGRKDDGRLEEAIRTEAVTPNLLQNIVDRTFYRKQPMFITGGNRP